MRLTLNKQKWYYPVHYETRQRGSAERQTASMPQEADAGKRRLLTGAATLVGAGVVIGALSSAEPVYAAVKKIADFRDRRGNINSANSASHDTQVTTQSISQGEPGNVQSTPTPDATVIAAQKDLVIQQDQKAQTDNRFAFWTDIGTSAAVLITGVLGTVGYLYNRNKDRKDRLTQEENRRLDQRIDREKRDEARFQEAVLALGKDETKLAAVTTLRTFLQEEGKGYERFYMQIFEVTVGFLQNRVVDPNNPKPDTFNKAIIKLFIESFPLARKLAKEKFEKEGRMYDRSYLDASYIKLDGFDRMGLGLLLDLSEAWMPGASLNNVNLLDPDGTLGADLSGACLDKASFNKAILHKINLSGATLFRADLSGATLTEADLSGANLYGANLRGADLTMANLSKTSLSADLSGANLKLANLSNAFLTVANPSYNIIANFGETDLYDLDYLSADLSGANLKRANLTGIDLSGVKLEGTIMPDGSKHP